MQGEEMEVQIDDEVADQAELGNQADQTDQGVQEDQEELGDDQAELGNDQADPEEVADGEGDEEDESKLFDDKQQGVVNKIVGKKTKALREMERRAEKAEEKALAMEQKYQPAKTARPVVPPLPDTFDPQYAAKMQQRDRSIHLATQWDGNEQQSQQYAQNQQQDLQSGFVCFSYS